jgi:hypothetical protein
MEVGANFNILDVAPDLVTQILGLTPDGAWRKGDRSPVSGTRPLFRKEDCWTLTEKTSDAYLGVGWLLEKLIDRVSGSMGTFANLPSEAKVYFDVWITLDPNSSNPSCCVSSKVIQFLAATNAELDIDILGST